MRRLLRRRVPLVGLPVLPVPALFFLCCTGSGSILQWLARAHRQRHRAARRAGHAAVPDGLR
eukprot:7231462-Prymnesium_polylepis.1